MAPAPVVNENGGTVFVTEERAGSRLARGARAAHLILVAVCLAGVGGPVTGQASPAPRGTPPAREAAQAGYRIVRPVVRPPRLPQPPVIDGRLDDAVWADAAHITELVQRRPLDGVPASEASDIYLGYDSDHLYVGLHAHYSNPDMLRANRRDRDESIEDDLFLIYFDPFLDRQRAYVFTVNGYGVQGDAILRAGAIGGGRFGVPRGDASWDVLFDTAAEIVADGFVAEMAIPFKSLRYPRREPGAPHRWGLQIARIIGGKDEADVWSPTSRDIAGFLPQMGTLDGMTDLSRSHNLEILPTLTAVRFGALDRRTGAFEEGELRPEGGVNVKYGVTSDLTADVAVNPDFSQIESDLPQIEINQRFALFYPELRPFFLEGAEIFNIPAPVTAVHTRTIVDPDFGAKLTGKVGRTTLGVMYASDAAASEGAAPEATRSGAAQVFVGRARYDLYAESHVGTVLTSREHADGHSRLAGADANFRLGDTHAAAFRAMGTDHEGRGGGRTSGYLLDAVFSKRGRNLRYSLGAYALSPEFRTDVGFVRRTDQRYASATGGYRWWPEHWLRNWGPEFLFARNYDFAGVLQDEIADAGINLALARNSFVAGNVRRERERYRGIDFVKTRSRVFGRVDTSRRIGISLEYRRGDQVRFVDRGDPYLGHEHGISASINLRPVPRFRSAINVTTNRFTDPGRGGAEVFDVRIFRALTTYQFTTRLLLRNISEYNTLDGTLDLNFLLTYRVNAGTVFYAGYDDHYQQADRIELGPTDWDEAADWRLRRAGRHRTNRAVFLKLQYLFRY